MSQKLVNKQYLRLSLDIVKRVTGSVAGLHDLQYSVSDPDVLEFGLGWDQRTSLDSDTEKARILSYYIYQVASGLCPDLDAPNLSSPESQETLELIAEAHRGLEDFVIALLVGNDKNDNRKQGQAIEIRKELRENNFAQLFLRAETLIENIQQTQSDIGKAAGGLLLNVYAQRLPHPTISISTPRSYLFTDRRPNYANNNPPISECFTMGVAGQLSTGTQRYIEAVETWRDVRDYEFPVARVFAAAMKKLKESERPGITGLEQQLAAAVAVRAQ
ncbi:MAG: hypothetical protein FJX22_04565 [Alphaproteobacteria bacterium]|nr:hypothetical protein [Alphaproteobacteria bacterium]